MVEPKCINYDSVEQPESSPISADQLALEVKGIYAGLEMAEAGWIKFDHVDRSGERAGLTPQPDSSRVLPDQLVAEFKSTYEGPEVVEASCIHADPAKATDPDSGRNSEQWRALTALHRTLLYEHHDFLVASQHPAAPEVLRDLATKYCMPARMWKHGIHAFLEVLRHGMPGSQEHILAFIYLAYQMVALLYETVHDPKDTWIECLGDLARYRLAVADSLEVQPDWGSVASRWYESAADRHPAAGRLYHHLGILERRNVPMPFSYKGLLIISQMLSNSRRDRSNSRRLPLPHGGGVDGGPQPVKSLITFYHDHESSCPRENSINTFPLPGRCELSKVSEAWLTPGQMLFAFFYCFVQFHSTSHFPRFPLVERGKTAQPLPEDFNIRGLIWAHVRLPVDWFGGQGNDDDRQMDMLSTPKARDESAPWQEPDLGCHLEDTQDEAIEGHTGAGITLCPSTKAVEEPKVVHLDLAEASNTAAAAQTQLECPVLDQLRASDLVVKGPNTKPRRFLPQSLIDQLSSFIGFLVLNAFLCTVKGVYAAPIGTPRNSTFVARHSSTETTPHWIGNIEQISLQLITVIGVVAAIGNVIQIALRRPNTEPKLTGDLAIGCSLAAWVLIQTAPLLVHLRNAVLGLWLACESDYVARMCCVRANGRVYVWGSIASGLLMAMFMAALQSDERPTLATMAKEGLPSAPFLIGCAARVLPRAVGYVRA